jgi:flagellar biosynthesis protein FlhG
MNDQANILRQLVRQDAASRPGGGKARLVVVAAGKGGVGTTTVAVNLALTLARGGRGCLLVDGNRRSADATTLCNLDARFGISQVVAGWRNVEETLLDGPGGIQVLPGVWDGQYDDQWTDRAQARLIDELLALGRRPASRVEEFVVVDAGCGLGTILGRFWAAADVVVAITTPDSMAIMDVYAAIKVHVDVSRSPVHLVINQAANTQQAAEVHQRLARACHRFLALTIQDAGYLPMISREADQAAGGLFALHAPESTAARCLDRVAQGIIRSTLARSASEGGSESGLQAAKTG